MAYDNTNRGALFLNDKKGNDKAPDYKGDVYFGTEKKSIAAWQRERPNGETYLSLQISEPFVKTRASEPVQQVNVAEIEKEATPDSDLPF